MLFNKILGAVLASILAILGIKEFSNMVFGKGGHHGHHAEEEKPMNDRFAEAFAYYIPVEDAGPVEAVEEEIFDLGAQLASADASAGETVYKQQCMSCHTIEDGGANKTGPNLHGLAGRPVATHAGFNYSGSLADYGAANGGAWSYENLNEFILNPKGTVSGTYMAYPGLKRDSQRMDLIAYLASETPSAPAFPEPLPPPAEEDDAVAEAAIGEDGEVIEASAEAGAEIDTTAMDMPVAEDVSTDAVGDAIADLEATVNEAADNAEETVNAAADEAEAGVADAVETAEAVAEETADDLEETVTED